MEDFPSLFNVVLCINDFWLRKPAVKECGMLTLPHGVKAGMNKSMPEMRNAVRSGYWNLLRYDPRLADKGKNPLMLDSSKPTENSQDFLMGDCA